MDCQGEKGENGVKDLEIMEAAIESYGESHQILVAIEEMSELTKELVKNQRGEWNHNEIAEEMADVYIMLCQLQMIFGIDDGLIEKYKNFKMKRLQKGLEEKI